jgi:hypothetical protein
MLDHVKHEKCPHPIVGETLPHFGCKEVGKRAGMAEKFVASAMVTQGKSVH